MGAPGWKTSHHRPSQQKQRASQLWWLQTVVGGRASGETHSFDRCFSTSGDLASRVSCYLSESNSASFFHAVSECPSLGCSPPHSGSCVLIFVFRTFEACSDGLGA